MLLLAAVRMLYVVHLYLQYTQLYAKNQSTNVTYEWSNTVSVPIA